MLNLLPYSFASPFSAWEHCRLKIKSKPKYNQKLVPAKIANAPLNHIAAPLRPRVLLRNNDSFLLFRPERLKIPYRLRRYAQVGLQLFVPFGKSFFNVSGSVTLGKMTQSCPHSQLAGVATLQESVSCKESTTRKIS